MNKLVFGDIEVSKSEFYENKKGIKLKDVIVDKIAVSNKIKGNNEAVKYYIGYLDESVAPLCLILPQMSGWIKYFENGGKSMSFLTFKMMKCISNTTISGIKLKNC